MFRTTLLTLLLITCGFTFAQESVKDQLFGKWKINEIFNEIYCINQFVGLNKPKL